MSCKLAVSNVTNACSLDASCISECVKNCWQDCPAYDFCSSALSELYPRMELSIAQVHYNGNANNGIDVHTDNHTHYTVCRRFDSASLSPFWCRRFDHEPPLVPAKHMLYTVAR